MSPLSSGQYGVREANASLFINQAKIVIPNILVASGVVHVIDSVLHPYNYSGFSDLSSTFQIPVSSQTPGSINDSNVAAPGGMSNATKIGIGIGIGLGGCLALIGLLFWALRRHSQSRSPDEPEISEPGVAVDNATQSGIAADDGSVPGVAVGRKGG